MTRRPFRGRSHGIMRIVQGYLQDENNLTSYLHSGRFSLHKDEWGFRPVTSGDRFFNVHVFVNVR
jgi:hypothetical protein